MTTWTNAKVTSVTQPAYFGKSLMRTWTIAGVAGDTGGTLTITGFKQIDNYSVQVEVATGPAGYDTGLTHYTAGKTVVVGYTNPADTHTVRIKVWGPK
jgi:hypothetical protein